MRNLPHLGQRILKTGIAVFLCLVIYHLLGYRGDTMPTEAATVRMPSTRDSRARLPMSIHTGMVPSATIRQKAE